MTASMWQVVKKQDVMSYWEVAEFVSLVMDMVPELLMDKHRTQLNLGLRARYILELCCCERMLEPQVIMSLLSKVTPLHPNLIDMKQSEEEEAAANFPELIQALLKDTEDRDNFFLEVFPVEFGPQYDRDLETLFWEFLCRLNQLMPVPDLEQTASWLKSDCSLLEDCLNSISQPTDMKHLLQYHKSLGNLEQHVPPSTMGDSIISSLSAVPPRRVAKPKEQSNRDGPLYLLHGLGDDAHTLTHIVDDEVAEVMVTDYAEVELDSSAHVEAVMAENSFERTESALTSPGEATKEGKMCDAGEEPIQGNAESVSDMIHPEGSEELPTSSKGSSGPHDCPDCEKTFRFASSLIAHRVIHTGERPHKCRECGRCFSFRQSLDRHRYTHVVGRKYDCVICGESFHSLSARTEHKQKHMEDTVYTCQLCNKNFTWELSLARHLKTHTGDHNKKPTDSLENEQEVVVSQKNGSKPALELPVIACQVQAPVDPKEVPGEEGATSEPGGLVPELVNEVISLVKVRTSGRKRKPTMKVLNLQKLKGKVSAPEMKQERAKVTPTASKPVLFNCSAEHSYGSTVISSSEGSVADGSSAAFSCPQCSFAHAAESEVQQHIDQVHCAEAEDADLLLQPLADEEGRFSCPDCEKTFRFQSLLKAHKRKHTGEQPFLCSQCGRCFSFKQSLERHKQTHKAGRKYECLICGELFKSLAAQREHKSTHMENGEYVCTECGRAFAWKSALVRHLKTHGEDVDKVEPTYKCPHCDVGFSCASYLNRHLQTHQEEKRYTCNCGKSFAYRAALTSHQRIHMKERPHKCTQCGKGFLYKGGLLSHMKIHSEEMPFMCSHCGKSFKRERNMKKHERCHTRENVFSCSQCDKSFVYKATLIRHELTHSGERPYLCSDCGKGFFSHAELLKHERFHTGHKPFQCPHCGKKFTQSCYLTIHLRYHTGARPYSCAQCDKSFLTANRLKRHQRTHTGEKPFLCGECGKSFRQSYNLKMHQRTHTIKLT
ncbi:uncharacterized protein LOC143001228 isoform X2 [Genypterus blacodes]